MAVVANISVLLSARVEAYRSQIGFARQDNESFARSATAAGLKVRDAGKAMDALRQRSFELLTTQQKLTEEIQAIGHLYRAGVIDQRNYEKAIKQVNEAYRQKAAAEAAKGQESFNAAVQRGTQLLRPQIAAQKEAMTEYKKTVAALDALQKSGTANRLGITAEEIENRRREAFLVGQAKFQGKDTPDKIQERTRAATEAATAAVGKFNQQFQTARQRLSDTLGQLRVLREQAELAGKPLDIEAQQQFVRKAIEDYRKDSGIADRLRREQKAQEENNQAIQRGIQLMDQNFAARQRLSQQLRDIQAAAKFDPDRFGGDKLEKARQQAFEAYRAETQKSTELAAASVDKFNQRFVTAKQRLRETIGELRTMREQAKLAGKVLDEGAQQQFIRRAVEDFRRDSGLTEKLKKEQKAQEENNQAIQRGIQLMDKNFGARQRLGQQLRDIAAAARFDPDRFGGQQMEKARQEAIEAYRSETQRSTELAAASVDKFNQRFVTAKQRLRETINELRTLRQQAAESGRILDRTAEKQFIKKAVDDFRRDAGLDTRLKAEAAARNESNLAAERGLQLVDKEFAVNNRRRQQLLQQLADINTARQAYQGLDVRKFAVASRGIFDELNALAQGKESPAAIAEREAAKLAANKVRIEKENVDAIKASQTAEQFRAQEYTRINQDIVNGLNAEAAARRRLAVDAEFNKRTGVDQRQQIETDLVTRYNEAIARGVQLARPARQATDEYRQSIKDLNKALEAARINQQEYNIARMQATRLREDNSLSPILQNGINQVAPYRQVLQTVTRTIEDMRVAVASGKVTQEEYNRVMQSGIRPSDQLAQVQAALTQRYRQNQLTLREYVGALRMAKTEIMGKTTILQRLLTTFGVFRTVLIGMSSAQLYSGIFTAFSDSFEFEPKIRRAIALFGELEDSQKQALRSAVISETFNNVPILERVQVLEELAKDGIAADVASRSLGKTLAFASVSGLGAQDAVSKVSEVLKAYRLETGNAQEDTLRLSQIMDLLVTSANQTASNVQQVAEALIRTAPQANQLGIEIRDAARGVISLSEIGRKGEVGGNELAIALRDLAIKATENKEAFADLGVTFFETDGFFVGMETSVQQLSDALARLSPEQRTNALLTIGVTQKASQFQQQLISLVDVLKQSKTSFEDTNGAVDRLQRDSMTELLLLTNQVRSAFTFVINSTLVAFFESVAGAINRTSREFRSWIALAVGGTLGFVIGLRSVVLVMALITSAVRVYRAALLAVATVQTFLVAMSGPAGWGLIALAIGAATATAWGLYTAVSAIEDEMAKGIGLNEVNDSVDRLNSSLADSRAEIGELRAAMSDVFTNIQSGFNARGFFQADASIAQVQNEIANASAEQIESAKESISQLQAIVNGFFAQNQAALSDDQLRRYFEDLNAQIRNVSRAMKTVDVTQLKQLREELARIIEDTKTPLEKAFEEIQKLAAIREAKLPITPVIERRKIDQVLESLIGTFEQEANNRLIRLNVGAEIRGSQEEFSSRVTVSADERSRNETRNYQERSLILARQQVKGLDDVSELLRELIEKQDNEEQIRIDRD